ncbi:MAG: hypothetical protein ACLR6B_02020 [Blautia sp.]
MTFPCRWIILSEKLIRELSVLEPFGKGKYKSPFLQIGIYENLAGTDHRKKPERTENAGAECVPGCTMEALYFGDIPGFEDYIRGRISALRSWSSFCRDGRPRWSLSMTYYPSVNEFRGNKTLQIGDSELSATGKERPVEKVKSSRIVPGIWC